MNEQEIIDYLKRNMSNGIAFRFMPVEVRNWVANHLDDCTFLTAEGIWDKASRFFRGEFDAAAFNVFGLLASYKSKESGWVEFEIDENGCYRILDTDMRFHWSEWNKPLWVYGKDENRSWYLTAFGGWFYEGEEGCWNLLPLVLKGSEGYRTTYKNDDGSVRPAIPKKIRFWRTK